VNVSRLADLVEHYGAGVRPDERGGDRRWGALRGEPAPAGNTSPGSSWRKAACATARPQTTPGFEARGADGDRLQPCEPPGAIRGSALFGRGAREILLSPLYDKGD